MGTAIVQGQLWGIRARDWAEVQEGLYTPLFHEILHQSKVGAGSFVLDIGCGSGLFCQMAAALGAQVSGLDASEALLEIARWRAPRGDFRAGEMEELPYSPKTFDLVTGLNSFQFAASPVNALVEARRVSKPGASVVIAVFDKPEDTEARAFFAAMASILSPPPGAPGPFALSSEGALEALVTQAGLTPGVVQEIDCPWQYPDATTMLRGLLASGPAQRAMQLAGEQTVRAAIVKALAPFKTASGAYILKNKTRYMIAKA